MIKAIIFDCFGVLTTESFYAFQDEYLKDSDKKREEANKAMDAVNAGLSSHSVFIKKLAAISEMSEEKVEHFLSNNQPNKPLFDYIRLQLKPKYKIGLLSNAGDNWLEELFGKEDLKLFDDTVLSFEHGVIKPSKGIFFLSAKRLEANPENCVFIDDRQKHIDGAKDSGMKGVRYKDFEQMKAELERLLADSDR